MGWERVAGTLALETDSERLRDVGLAAAIALVAALLPFHRCFSFPFALDDYTFLYQVAGLEPAPFSLRRWLAVHGWYALLLRLFGPDPRAWHVGSFVLHVVNAVWVFALARRLGASRAAAWIATGLFAASPLAFSVVYWAAGIQEIGSSFFVLAAAWIAGSAGRRRWLAVPLFALAMLCKESVLAAPLALALLWGPRGRRLAAAMFAAGIAVFVAGGLHQRMLVANLESPYATAYDATLLVNLATLWVWFLSPWRAYPDRLAAPQPGLVLPAVALAGALAVYLAFTRGRHARVLGLACLWFVALLLPVLPLRQHTYAYYAYLPQVGFLVLAGAGLERLARRAPAAMRPAWLLGLGAAAVAGSILCAARTTRAHETLTLPNSVVPHDPVVRYGRAAGALVAAVREAGLPPGVDRVVFMSLPQQLGKAAQTPGEKRPGMVRVRRFPVRDSYRDGKLMAPLLPQVAERVGGQSHQRGGGVGHGALLLVRLRGFDAVAGTGGRVLPASSGPLPGRGAGCGPARSRTRPAARSRASGSAPAPGPDRGRGRQPRARAQPGRRPAGGGGPRPVARIAGGSPQGDRARAAGHPGGAALRFGARRRA